MKTQLKNAYLTIEYVIMALSLIMTLLATIGMVAFHKSTIQDNEILKADYRVAVIECETAKKGNCEVQNGK